MIGQYLMNAIRPQSPTMTSAYESNPYGDVNTLQQNLTGAQNALTSALGQAPQLQAPPQLRQPGFGTPQILASLGLEVLNQIFNKGRDPGAGLAGVLGGQNQRAQTEYQNSLAQSQFQNQQAIRQDERNLRGLEIGLNTADRNLSKAMDFEQDQQRRVFQEKQAELQRQQYEKEWNRQLEQDKFAAKRHEDSMRAQGLQREADRLSSLMDSLEKQTKEGAVEVVKGIAAELGMPPEKAAGYIRQAEINRDQAEREVKAKETDAAFNQQYKQAQMGFERQRIGLEQERVNIAKDEAIRKGAGKYTPEEIKSQKDTLTKAESKYYAAQTVPAKTPEAAQLAKDTARANWAAEWVKMKQMQGLKIDTKLAEFITPEVVKNPDGFLKQAERAARAGVMPPEKLAEIRVLLGPILKNKNPDMSGSIGKGPLKPFAPKLPDGFKIVK